MLHGSDSPGAHKAVRCANVLRIDQGETTVAGDQIKAHKIASIGGTRGSDGEVGLVRFRREKPMTNGETDLWMAVPNQLLPYLAVQAIHLLPQPPNSLIDHPHVLDAKEVAFGVGPTGELIVSMTIEQQATLSFQLDAGQAMLLAQAIRDALGKADFSAPSGVKPS